MHLIRIYDPVCEVCHVLDGPDKLIAKAEGWSLDSYRFEQIMKSSHPFLTEIREWIVKNCIDEITNKVHLPTYFIADGNWELQASSTVENVEKLYNFVEFYKAEALVFMPGLYDTELFCVTSPECEHCPEILKHAARAAYYRGWGYRDVTTEEIHKIGGRLLEHVRMFMVDSLGKIKLPVIMIANVQTEDVQSTAHCKSAEDIIEMIENYDYVQSLQFSTSENPLGVD